MKFNNALRLVTAVVISECVGLFGSIFTAPSIPSWYAMLIKPPLNPPAWIFAPVWTILYLLMGIAAFLVWRKGFDKEEIKTALAIFAVQLILNALWTVVFFGLRDIQAALIEIALLWIAILVTIVFFSKISRVAALLLLPYLFWVSFAMYLNATLWRLNT